MGWFFSGSEPTGGYSVISEEVVPDDTSDGDLVDNACTLLAADKLTGRSEHSWPPEVISHVKSNRGIADFSLVEKHAQVTGHASSEVTCYENGSILLESERGSYELEANEKLIISYETTPGRGHSICIAAEEFSDYARTHTITHIFTKR